MYVLRVFVEGKRFHLMLCYQKKHVVYRGDENQERVKTFHQQDMIFHTKQDKGMMA